MYVHGDQQKNGNFNLLQMTHKHIFTHDSFNKILRGTFIIKLTPLCSKMIACMSIVQFDEKEQELVMFCLEIYKWDYKKENLIVMFQI